MMGCPRLPSSSLQTLRSLMRAAGSPLLSPTGFAARACWSRWRAAGCASASSHCAAATPERRPAAQLSLGYGAAAAVRRPPCCYNHHMGGLSSNRQPSCIYSCLALTPGSMISESIRQR